MTHLKDHSNSRLPASACRMTTKRFTTPAMILHDSDTNRFSDIFFFQYLIMFSLFFFRFRGLFFHHEFLSLRLTGLSNPSWRELFFNTPKTSEGQKKEKKCGFSRAKTTN
jgi:hypothetical protein